MLLDGTYDANNVFAKILRGDAPTVTVYEDGDVLAFMDLFPQSEGHVLVISKGSTARNIVEVDATTLKQLIGAVQKITTAICAALQPDGVVVAQLNGQAAGQTVDHFHIHIIPRWAGRPMKGHGQGERADPDRLRGLASKVASALASSSVSR